MFGEALKESSLNEVAVLGYANTVFLKDPQKFISIVSPYIKSATSAESAALFLVKRALVYARLGERELAIRDICAIAGVEASDEQDESNLLTLVGFNSKLTSAMLETEGGPATTWLVSAALAGCSNYCKEESQAALKIQYQEAAYFYMSSSTDWVTAHGGYGSEACILDYEHEPMYKSSPERFMKVISGLDGKPPRPYRVFH